MKIQSLHPTLKACACGHIGSRTQLYRHFDEVKRLLKANGDAPAEFFAAHGEVPLNTDDPRIDHVVNGFLKVCLNNSNAQ